MITVNMFSQFSVLQWNLYTIKFCYLLVIILLDINNGTDEDANVSLHIIPLDWHKHRLPPLHWISGLIVERYIQTCDKPYMLMCFVLYLYTHYMGNKTSETSIYNKCCVVVVIKPTSVDVEKHRIMGSHYISGVKA